MTSGTSAPAPDRVRRWRWLLPLLLTVLPLIPLRQEADAEARTVAAETARRWLDDSEPWATLLKRSSRAEFWLELAGERLRRRLRRCWQQGGDGRPDRVLAAGPLHRLVPGLPPVKVWLATLPVRAGGRWALQRGPNLESGPRLVIESMFSTAAASDFQALPDATILARIQALLGNGFPAELLTAPHAGQAFAAFHDGRPGFALWQVVRIGGRVRAGFVVFLAFGPQHRDLPLALTLRHWPSRVAQPAFFRIPVPRWPGLAPAAGGQPGAPVSASGAAAVSLLQCERPLAEGFQRHARLDHGLVHPTLFDRPVTRRWLERQARRIRLRPSGRPDRPARFELLTAELGQVLVARDFWGRWVALDELSGAIGLLIEDRPRSPPSFLERIARAWSVAIIGLWVLLGLHAAHVGHLWTPGLRQELLLWVLGLMALPIALGLGTGVSFFRALEANLLRQTERRLEQSLRAIESGEGRTIDRQLKACRRIWRSPEVYAIWTALAAGRKTLQAELDAGFAVATRSLPLAALVVMRAGSGVVASRFSDELAPAGRKSFLFICSQFAQAVVTDRRWSRRHLIASGPAAARVEVAGQGRVGMEAGIGTSTPAMSHAHRDPTGGGEGAGGAMLAVPTVGPPGSEEGTTPIASAPAAPPGAGDSLLAWISKLIPVDSGLSQGDRVERLWFGERRYMIYHRWLDFAGSRYTLILVWNQLPEYRRQVYADLPSIRNLFRDLDIEAFHESGGALQPVRSYRHGQDLRQFAQRFRTHPGICQVGEGAARSLVLARPSVLPGLVLVARRNLHAVHQLLVIEGLHRLVPLALLSLGLVGIGAAWLSRWLGEPLVRMAAGLRQVAAGDLTARVGDDSRNELGQAARQIDRLTRTLSERRVLTRFVAPQVLELVAGGDLAQAASAQRRQVAVLVSDIRNFTTMTESWAPSALFRELNRHLTATAGVIGANDGVIDRFIGDAVVAVFHPLPGAVAPELRAVRAAVGIMAAHRAAMAARAAEGLPVFAIGCGIDRGEVICGITGDPDVRLDHTVLGEPLQTAAKLENASKRGATTRIILSAAIRTGLRASGWTATPLPEETTGGGTAAGPEPVGFELDPEPARSPEVAASGSFTPAPGAVAAPSMAGASGASDPAASEVSGRSEESLPRPAGAGSSLTAAEIGAGDRGFRPAATDGFAAPAAGSPSGATGARPRETPVSRTATGPTDTRSEVPRCGHGWPRETPVSRIATGPTDTRSEVPRCGHGWPRETPVSRMATGPTDTACPDAGSIAVERPGGDGVLVRGVIAVVVAFALAAIGDLCLRSWTDDALRRRQEAAEIQTADDVLSLERGLGAKSQIQQLIRGLVQEAMAGGEAGGSSAALNRIGQAMRRLERCVAGFAWCLVDLRPDGDPTRPRVVSRSRRQDRWWSTRRLENLASGTIPALLATMRQPVDLRDAAPRLDTLASVTSDVGRLYPGVLGACTRTRHGDEERWLMVEPLLDASWWDWYSRQEGRAGVSLDLDRRMARHLRHGLIVVVDPARLDPRTGLALSLFSLRRSGAVVDTRRVTRSGRSGDTIDRILDWGMREPRRPPVAGDGRDRLVVRSATVALDRTVELRVRRRLAPPGILERHQHRLRVGIWWCAIGLALALLMAGGAGFRWLVRLSPVLVGAFVAMLLPITAVSLHLLERNAVENAIGVEGGERERLLRLTDAFEAGIPMHDTAAFRTLHQWFRRPGFLARFQADPLPATAPVTVVASWSGRRWLEDFAGRVDHHGQFILNLNLGDSYGRGYSYPVFRDRGTFQGDQNQRRGSGAMLERMLQPNSARRRAMPDLERQLTDDQVDQFVAMIANWQAPRLSARMMMGLRHFSNASLAQDQGRELTYQEQMADDARLLWMRLLWGPPAVLYQQLDAWEEAARRQEAGRFAGDVPTPLQIGRQFQASFVYRPPFFRRRSHSVPGDPGHDAFIRPVSTARAAVIGRAVDTGVPAAAVIEDAAGKVLLLARRSRVMTNLTLQAESPIGLIHARLAAEHRRRRIWLFGLIVLAVLLAREVARQFLEPVLAMTRACDRVAAGERQVRLAVMGGRGELATLIDSFNAVAEGVDEGRLLGRFVAAAALDSARHGVIEGGEGGEQRVAAILFAGLVDFKNWGARADPAASIAALNLWLRECAGVVRRHGGDVDKFIGDKVLAVFDRDRLGGEAATIRAAMTAAEELATLRCIVHLDAISTYKPGAALGDGKPRRAGGAVGAAGQSPPAAMASATGVGVVMGPVLAGVLGSAAVRLEFTVIGDTVNLASRLCDLATAEPAGGVVLDDTVAEILRAAGDDRFVPRIVRLDVAAVKGKRRQVVVHRLRRVAG